MLEGMVKLMLWLFLVLEMIVVLIFINLLWLLIKVLLEFLGLIEVFV